MTDPSSMLTTVLRAAWRRRWAISAIAVLLIALGAGLAFWFGQSVPAGWRQARRIEQETTAEQRLALAERLENRVVNAVSFTDHFLNNGNPRLPVTAEIELSVTEVNAWLETRLPLWLRNVGVRLPETLREPTFWIESDHAVLAVSVQRGDEPRILSIAAAPRFHEDGTASLTIEGVRLGRLPLPTNQLLDRVKQLSDRNGLDPKSRDALDVALRSKRFPPVRTIDSQRQTRITGVRFENDRVVLTVRMERRDD